MTPTPQTVNPDTVSWQEALERIQAAYREELRREIRPRNLGVLAGRVWMSDDFDAPLPDDVLAEFEAAR